MSDQTKTQIHPDQTKLFEQATQRVIDQMPTVISKERQRLADAELKALDAIRTFAFKRARLEGIRGTRNAVAEDIFDAAQAMRQAEGEANTAVNALMNAMIAVAQAEGEL